MDKKELFHQRLKVLIGSEEPFRWAKRMGIPSATFARIWSNHDIPKHDHLTRIAEKSNVSLDWLLMGKEDAFQDGTEYVLVPVLGLANCGVAQGWYNESEINSHILLPSFLTQEEASAVICRGQSMIPAGIPDGAVCLVYPKRPVELGKPTLIRTRTFSKGREIPLATIKILEAEDDESVTLKGWLDADETGYQSSFTEKRLKNCITQIAPVGNVLQVALPESDIESSPVLDEGVLKQCFSALQPLYGSMDSEEFSELFLLSYKQILKTGVLDANLLQKMVQIIAGKR